MWFKRRYVDDILEGRKTDTIRVASTRLPHIGDVVPCSVGPVWPFAWVRIIDVAPVTLDELPPERAQEVRALIDVDRPLVRIVFAVIPDHAAPQTRTASE